MVHVTRMNEARTPKRMLDIGFLGTRRRGGAKWILMEETRNLRGLGIRNRIARMLNREGKFESYGPE